MVTSFMNVSESSLKLTIHPNPSANGLFVLSEYTAWELYNSSDILIKSRKSDRNEIKNQQPGSFTIQTKKMLFKVILV